MYLLFYSNHTFFLVFYFFFFQAEDGIRDADVTGVQTCALPILLLDRPRMESLSRCRCLLGGSQRISKPGDGLRLQIGRASCRERV